jgi:pilus assembly protein Flp/PilA
MREVTAVVSGRAYTVCSEFKSALDGRLTILKKDEDGAALIEYTVLLGILLIAVIAIILFVGSWISTQWSGLSSAISGKGV